MQTTTSSEKGFFGAFIMTYERPQIVLDSIKILLDQSFPPEYILIIDNSQSSTTEEAVEKFSNPMIGYHRVGYNSGPAGAASIGLQKLTEKGFKWIYWGDDDNPPVSRLIFEKFFSKIEKFSKANTSKIGVFGARGGNLNKLTGRIRSLTNSQLQKSDVIDVDLVPGGHTMLVNAEVVKQNIFPKEKLFFGFEELDFCLKVKKKGFRVMVDAENWLNQHVKEGNIKGSYKWDGASFGNPDVLWRNYYSTRNLLYIYSVHGYYMAFMFLMVKSILRSLIGYRFGINYGKKNMTIQWKAILHFFTSTFGEIDLQ